MEYCVHHHLEGGRGVGEAEKHYSGLKEAFHGKKSGLPFVSWFNPDVVIPLADIELGKEGTATEAVNSLWDQRGDITVLFHPFINGSIVLDWVELPILLFDEEEIGSIGAP
jgi:hypothetical protein